MVKYRHEYKYIVSQAQSAELEMRAECIMRRDSHVSDCGVYKGIYNIRSVYFDDIDNSCYYENENGTDPREKFRIRIYNHSDERISLELKSKRAGKCLKKSCRLTREQCELILAGICPDDIENIKYPLDKFIVQMKTRKLKPVIIVEYDRTPFVCQMGNVRVTLDRNIRSSTQCDKFFDKNLLLRPVLPIGQHVLEVKWDELLPDYIYHALQLRSLQWTSFSKYYLSRKYAPLKAI